MQKRLKILKALYAIKVTRIDESEKYRRVYFKARKWNPIIVLIALYSIIYYVVKESFVAVKDIARELNMEDSIQINKSNNGSKWFTNR